MPEYPVPDRIKSLGVRQADYNKWLRGRSIAHRKRDGKRVTKTGHAVPALEVYMGAIHTAVERCEGVCEYTGESLHWHLIGTWNNDEARTGGAPYKRKFAGMPTVDHVHGADGRPISLGDLKVTSWSLNDAKGDMALDQFLTLCHRVVATMGCAGKSEDTSGRAGEISTNTFSEMG